MKKLDLNPMKKIRFECSEKIKYELYKKKQDLNVMKNKI